MKKILLILAIALMFGCSEDELNNLSDNDLKPVVVNFFYVSRVDVRDGITTYQIKLSNSNDCFYMSDNSVHLEKDDVLKLYKVE